MKILNVLLNSLKRENLIPIESLSFSNITISLIVRHNPYRIMTSSLMRSATSCLILCLFLISVLNAANEGHGTSSPHSSQSQHQYFTGSSTSNLPVRPRVQHQSRFVRASNHGESRYFGSSEPEQRMIAMDRARSISRQTGGWRTTKESLSNRYKYLKTRNAEKQAKGTIVSPQQQQLRIGTSNFHGQQSHLQAQGSQVRMGTNALQTQSPHSRFVIKPTVRRVKEAAVVIDHPEDVQQHRLIRSPGSAFHKVQPNRARGSVMPTGQDHLSLRLSPPRASSPSHSTSSDHVNSQDAHMSKFFGGWKTPESNKRKRE